MLPKNWKGGESPTGLSKDNSGFDDKDEVFKVSYAAEKGSTVQEGREEIVGSTEMERAGRGGK